MAYTAKALYRGAASTTTTTTLYTVPAATTTIVTNCVITNTTGTAGTFTLTLDGIDIHTATAISGNSSIYIDLKQPLAATKIIKGGASATTINFHISGMEIA